MLRDDPVPDGMKRCGWCHVDYPADETSFLRVRRRQRGYRDGLSRCRVCDGQADRRWEQIEAWDETHASR
jgi:hypothetical protein